LLIEALKRRAEPWIRFQNARLGLAYSRQLKTATVTEIELSRLRDALGFFSFLFSTGTLMGMIFAPQKVNQRRLQCRFSLFSFDY